MKKYTVILLVLCLAVSVCACRQEEPQTTEPTVSTTAEATQTQPEDLSRALRETYYLALTDLYESKKYPDGSDCAYDEAFGDMEENRFAVCDVDADGLDELIISFATAPLVNMTETVFGYNAEDGMLIQQFGSYPALTYYSNGIILAESAHGHDGFMPYGIEKYDSESDTYENIAVVDLWLKGTQNRQDPDAEYPEDIDTEKAGKVYVITEGDTTTMRSVTDTQAWLNNHIKGADKIQIPYMALTKENIELLKS